MERDYEEAIKYYIGDDEKPGTRHCVWQHAVAGHDGRLHAGFLEQAGRTVILPDSRSTLPSLTSSRLDLGFATDEGVLPRNPARDLQMPDGIKRNMRRRVLTLKTLACLRFWRASVINSW